MSAQEQQQQQNQQQQQQPQQKQQQNFCDDSNFNNNNNIHENKDIDNNKLNLAEKIRIPTPEIASPLERTGDSAETIRDSSEIIENPSERIRDSSERIRDSSERIRDSSERIRDSSERIRDPSLNQLNKSPNLISMSPQDAPTSSPLAGEVCGPPNPTPGGSSSPSNPFNLTCMTCHVHFTSAEYYGKHDCVNSFSSNEPQTQTPPGEPNPSSDLNKSGDDSGILQSESEGIQENSSDVEKFDGKIVYNPDGSAYIFDSEMSEDDAMNLEIQPQEGSIVDSPTHPLPESLLPPIPPIENAFYVTKSNSFYQAYYGQNLSSSLALNNKGPQVPIVHSYRVISASNKGSKVTSSKGDSLGIKGNKGSFLDYTQVPIKPILMCFVCKLSFGYVRSFINHAMGDHSLIMTEEEKEFLTAKNASAILQFAGREKDLRVSFLEPVSHQGVLRDPEAQTGVGASNPTPTPCGDPPEPSPQARGETTKDVETENETSSNLCVKKEIDLFEHSPRGLPHLPLPPHLQPFPHNLHLPPPSPPFATPQHPAGLRTPDLSRKSPISALGGGRSSSVSPVTSMSPTSFSPITQLTGTIIGACPEHMSGRQQGMSCEKCDLILQQSRQLSGQMAFMHSRNSCKTLKCPKCNWHYKYQETLEIHMKEKHPENESTCIYCLTSQPHPRLARGETYTCGYKPYRCEVCNYSTTTKGNLSIHMQSDKHLNNMQELQNGGIPNLEGGSLGTSRDLSLSQSQSPNSGGSPKVSTPTTTPHHPQLKPKPMWRCDVCNYETNVARNLRIHMTSEKHTHNMMVLQQNVKHMQQISAMSSGDPVAILQMAHMAHDKPPHPPPEVAMADMAYNQALLIQMITGGGGGPLSGGAGPLGGGGVLAGGPLGGANPQDQMGPHFDLGINPEHLEPPPEPVPPNPRGVYSCCVCSNFNTDSLEQLNLHLQLDRSKLNENEVLIIVAGNYICKLCSYKTNLKANFQLHCKTDKHLQKLQLVNHILEGGPRNEFKLKYVSSSSSNSNLLSVRCNVCEFYTNNLHKLQLHSTHQRHEVMALLFKHLSAPELGAGVEGRGVGRDGGEGRGVLRDGGEGRGVAGAPEPGGGAEGWRYRCCLCAYSTSARTELLQHVRSARHLHMEQLHHLQRPAKPRLDIADVFRVEPAPPSHDAELPHSCPHCPFSTTEGEDRLQLHLDLEHPNRNSKSEGQPWKSEAQGQPWGSKSESQGQPWNSKSESQSQPWNSKSESQGQPWNSKSESQGQPWGSKSESQGQPWNSKSESQGQPWNSKSECQTQPWNSKSEGQTYGSKVDLEGCPRSSEDEGYKCPLCEQVCPDLSTLEKHAVDVHSVNSEGLQRLLLLVRLSNAAKKRGNQAEGNTSEGNNPEGNPNGEGNSGVREEITPSQEIEQEMKDERHAQDGGGGGIGGGIVGGGGGVVGGAGHRTPTPAPRLTPAPPPVGMASPASGDPSINPLTPITPQMAEMAAAINAIAHFQPFNPMVLAGLGLASLPLHLNPLMNLQPPLAPGLPPHPILDPISLANFAANQQQQNNTTQNQFFLKQQHQQQQEQNQHQQQLLLQQQQQQQQQKRGRTRITDEQLKILRAHFDINNSPSEEQISEMAAQSGLPQKVIKHWFRNTLFKERQRSKDSPYNFNIPPSTTLNLEEYEKTGETKIIPLNPDEVKEIVEINRSKDGDGKDKEIDQGIEKMDENPVNKPDGGNPGSIQAGIPGIQGGGTPQFTPHSSSSPPQTGGNNPHLISSASCSPVGSVSSVTFPQTFPPLSSPQTFPPLSSPQTFPPLSSPQTLSGFITGQLDGQKLPPTSTTPQGGLTNPSLPPHPSAGLSPTPSNLSYPTTPPGGNSSGGKRANRTRFTDYQIKVLQEFFENNAYPKDDDLEYLSKLLNLSPRVIVVWFQNARQKARKVYENQPPIDPMEENPGRFTRTPGLNYQCKKCLLVFQRYYELIRHQKTHCFKEEDAKRSAQAQAAAAQAAALYHDDTIDNNSNQSSLADNSSQSMDNNSVKAPLDDSFQCDKCSLVFTRFEQWREHQIVHLMNPALFINNKESTPAFPSPLIPSSQPSTSLPQATPPLPQNQPPISNQPTISTQFQQLIPPPAASPLKRKADESEDEQISNINEQQQRDKRLRTTILPEQLDYLYQKYQIEANPSRKMLETIAHEVGLKKRVVQVWFQNTRARERKGQFRAHAQVINKKCPFCPAIFKVKSALESHLTTKHSDQFSDQINIDALPDLDEHFPYGNYGNISSNISPPPPSSNPPPPPPPPSSSSIFPQSEKSENPISKYHEEAIRRYLTDVSINNNNPQQQQLDNNNLRGFPLNGGGLRREGEKPLDLSRPLELARSLGMAFNNSLDPHHSSNDPLKMDNLSKISEKMYNVDTLLSDDEYYHMDVSESDENEVTNSFESNPTSPVSSSSNSTKQNFSTSTSSSKRFRTQMTSTQVKLMKSVFVDYKTPTMTECEIFGKEIQLPKRVIQVWFQNARAKEKKAKLALMKILGQEPEPPRPPTECKVCNFEYSNKYSIQDHLFTRTHIDNMRAYIEKQKEESDQASASKNFGSNPGLNLPGLMNADLAPNYPQFGAHFPSNPLQLHMAQLMAINSELKQSGPSNLGPENPLNGESIEPDKSSAKNPGFDAELNARVAKNDSKNAASTDSATIPTCSTNSSAGGDLESSNRSSSDLNRLQLLQQVYQQMGLHGAPVKSDATEDGPPNSAPSNSNNSNSAGSQSNLVQFPMIEG